jgi:hypothetical protein
MTAVIHRCPGAMIDEEYEWMVKDLKAQDTLQQNR